MCWYLEDAWLGEQRCVPQESRLLYRNRVWGSMWAVCNATILIAEGDNESCALQWNVCVSSLIKNECEPFKSLIYMEALKMLLQNIRTNMIDSNSWNVVVIDCASEIIFINRVQSWFGSYLNALFYFQKSWGFSKFFSKYFKTFIRLLIHHWPITNT